MCTSVEFLDVQENNVRPRNFDHRIYPILSQSKIMLVATIANEALQDCKGVVFEQRM